MKKQSLKKFAMMLVFGLISIVSTSSVFAQAGSSVKFDVPFDFQVGSEKLEAGKYEMRRLNSKTFVLRNSETKETMLINSMFPVGNDEKVKQEKLSFNRYGERYFLREIYVVRESNGTGLGESKAERKLRRGIGENNIRIAKNTQPERVIIENKGN